MKKKTFAVSLLLATGFWTFAQHPQENGLKEELKQAVQLAKWASRPPCKFQRQGQFLILLRQ